MRLLILGGTSEARGLADLLVSSGVDVTTSLAGRVAAPRLPSLSVLARVVDVPALSPPPSRELITSRGPYTLDGELTLMRRHGSDILVTKDSGGTYTWPKMQAAAQLNAAVIVVRRPAGPVGVPTVHDVDAAAAWVRELG